MDIYTEEDPPGHPIASISDNPPELNLKGNPVLQKLLWDIWRLDKTPIYDNEHKQRNADTNGNFPGKGARWLTPRESVQSIFYAADMDIWEYNREQLKRQGGV